MITFYLLLIVLFMYLDIFFGVFNFRKPFQLILEVQSICHRIVSLVQSIRLHTGTFNEGLLLKLLLSEFICDIISKKYD